MPCNHELMNEFSPGTGTAHWVVPEDSPPQAQLSVENLRFQLVGSVPSWYPSRLHHTLALHNSIDHVKTRFSRLLIRLLH